MFPIVEKEIVNKGFISREEVLDYYAVGQCTPGPIVVNTSVLLGNRLGGFLGGLAAAVGVVVPSFVIILAIAYVLSLFSDIAVINHAFSGVRAAVLALIINAVINLWKTGIVDIISGIIFAATFVAMLLPFNISPILLTVLAALTGICAGGLKGRAGK